MSSAASLFSTAPINVMGVSKPTPKQTAQSQKLQTKNVPSNNLKEKRPFVKPNMSVAQVKEREGRTIFVGNVALKTEKKTLMRYFKKYGKIEKLWSRSMPLDLTSKINQKGFFYSKHFFILLI